MISACIAVDIVDVRARVRAGARVLIESKRLIGGGWIGSVIRSSLENVC